MGDMYIATIPQCPTHGKMKCRDRVKSGDGQPVYVGMYWICPGFDGEGCDHRAEEKDMDWTAVNAESFRINGMTVGDPIHLRATGQFE
jgi:hypothetical protein